MLTEEGYRNSCFPIQDVALESQCQRRGIRMAFLTLAPALGLQSVRLIKELHQVMNSPLTDSYGHEVRVTETLFLRMSFWATEAYTHIENFSPAEMAAIERCADGVFNDVAPMSQERFERLMDVVLNQPLDHEPAHLYRLN